MAIHFFGRGAGGGGSPESASVHSNNKKRLFLHITVECARKGCCFLLDQGGRGGDQRVLSFSVSFEEIRSGTVLSANDLWTEDEEWEGSLRDVWRGEGKRDEIDG